MSRTGFRSSLARHAPSMRDPDPANAKAAACKAWREQGMLLINLEWLTNEAGFTYGDRMLVEAIGDKLHGKRNGGGK